jgi:hypothetical protein
LDVAFLLRFLDDDTFDLRPDDARRREAEERFLDDTLERLTLLRRPLRLDFSALRRLDLYETRFAL